MSAQLKLTIIKDAQEQTFAFNEEAISALNSNYEEELLRVLEIMRKPRLMPWVNKSEHLIFDTDNYSFILGNDIFSDVEQIPEDPDERLLPYAIMLWEAAEEIGHRFPMLQINSSSVNHAMIVQFYMPEINRILNIRLFARLEGEQNEVLVVCDLDEWIDGNIGELRIIITDYLRRYIFVSPEMALLCKKREEEKNLAKVWRSIRRLRIPEYGTAPKTLSTLLTLLDNHTSCMLGSRYQKRKAAHYSKIMRGRTRTLFSFCQLGVGAHIDYLTGTNLAEGLERKTAVAVRTPIFIAINAVGTNVVLGGTIFWQFGEAYIFAPADLNPFFRR